MKDTILFYLQLHDHCKRKNLLAFLRQEDFKVTDRQLRATIDELIEADGHCIQSSGKGYKLVTNPGEYQGAIDYLNSYIFALLKRRRALKRNYNRLTAKLIPA